VEGLAQNRASDQEASVAVFSRSTKAEVWVLWVLAGEVKLLAFQRADQEAGVTVPGKRSRRNNLGSGAWY